MKKYKFRKQKKQIKTVYIFIIILVICTTIATGYSIFNTELKINGTAILKTPAVITPPDTVVDENNVTRFTSDAKFTTPTLGITMFKVESEEYDGINTITTNLRTMNNQSIFGRPYEASSNITLNITNNSGQTFKNGTINVIDYSDTKTAFGSRSQILSSTTVEDGSEVTITITGKMYGAYVTEGTFYKYEVSFDLEDGSKQYFYYILNILPKE
jgi:hypothetical protein